MENSEWAVGIFVKGNTVSIELKTPDDEKAFDHCTNCITGMMHAHEGYRVGVIAIKHYLDGLVGKFEHESKQIKVKGVGDE